MNILFGQKGFIKQYWDCRGGLRFVGDGLRFVVVGAVYKPPLHRKTLRNSSPKTNLFSKTFAF
ncbi:hypothetical protein DIT68_09840 [Brumimicrobium oceani]|uniref:Uncharacterized protein n=1 Tax=Brumimicrobium oceani TaxID=2100725 RepID=A0A2U2XBZ7_9FLAO|nr:hypothetical protein DIT68_09840 [Brumimicrobium oceani]